MRVTILSLDTVSRRRKAKGQKKIATEIVAKKFPNLMKTITFISKKLNEPQQRKHEENHTKANPNQITETYDREKI